MCHIFECHVNSSRTKRSLLTGCVSGDVVYLLKVCVLSLLSRVSRSTSISLSWVSLLFRPRRLSLSQPRGPPAQRHGGERERESEGWLSLRNINYSLEIRSHTRCWFLASLWIGSPHWVLFWPQCQWLLTYCHMCTRCLCSFCLFLMVWHGSQTLRTDGDSYYDSTNSIVSFPAQK